MMTTLLQRCTSRRRPTTSRILSQCDYILNNHFQSSSTIQNERTNSGMITSSRRKFSLLSSTRTALSSNFNRLQNDEFINYRSGIFDVGNMNTSMIIPPFLKLPNDKMMLANHNYSNVSQQQKRYMGSNKYSKYGGVRSRGGTLPASKKQQKKRGKKNPKQKSKFKNKQPKQKQKRIPQKVLNANQYPNESKPPPAYLRRTASPYAYISGCAAEEYHVDASTLFYEATNYKSMPPSFQQTTFRYTSPKKHLKYEYPKHGKPEVAFLGRSNVGKSSLLNALIGGGGPRTGNINKSEYLAKVSKRPGRTQMPNYFALLKNYKLATATPKKIAGMGTTAGTAATFKPSDPIGYIIDLPGYGYAAAPTEHVTQWQKDTQSFLLQRCHYEANVLSCVYLLIDSRRGIDEFDRVIMGWLDEAYIPYSIVFTKSDCVNRAKMVRNVNEACMRFHSLLYAVESYHNDEDEDEDEEEEMGEEIGGEKGHLSTNVFMHPVVHITSSKDNEGILELKWSLDSHFAAVKKKDKVRQQQQGMSDDIDDGMEWDKMNDDEDELDFGMEGWTKGEGTEDHDAWTDGGDDDDDDSESSIDDGSIGIGTWEEGDNGVEKK